MASHLTLKKLFEFMRKIDELNISSEAKDLLIHYMTHQGESYVFHNEFIAEKKGWSRQYFDNKKKELLALHIITTEHVYENGKRAGTHVTVIYDLPDDIFTNVRKPNVRKANVSSANVSKSNVIERKKINREEENRREGEKAAVAAEGDRLSAPAGAAASDAVPAAAAAADSPSPEISRSQDSKPRQSSKAAKASKAEAIPLSQNPPSQADVEAAVSQTAANSKIPGWTPEAIRIKAFTIWNHYELRQWKRADGTDITDLSSCVFCWMKRDGFQPPVMDSACQHTPAPVLSSGLLPAQKTAGAAEKQKSFKQLEKEWIERPLADPDTFIVESAAHSIFNATCEDEVQGTLNSTPVHLRERALALAEQMRKEQGDRPRIITTPSTFTYENEDETS